MLKNLEECKLYPRECSVNRLGGQLVFCQNYETSIEGREQIINIEEFADIFLRLQREGAHNINFVIPTHYVLQIIDAFKLAREKGLHLPVIYNSSGYEKVETLSLLDGYVSIYLPDFKYFKKEYAGQIGVENGFIQERGTASESFIPKFNKKM